MKKLAVANGTYMKDGQQKTSWVNIGVIGIGSNGKEYCLMYPHINLAGFPREAGKDTLMVSIFDDAQQGQPAQGGYAPPAQTPPAQYGGQVPPPQNNPPVEYYDAQGNLIPPRG